MEVGGGRVGRKINTKEKPGKEFVNIQFHSAGRFQVLPVPDADVELTTDYCMYSAYYESTLRDVSHFFCSLAVCSSMLTS